MRAKITELGRLNFLDDGGLVCWVTLHQQPPLEASAFLASYHWASPDLRTLALGDLVVHYDHGFARYRGRKKVEVEGSQKECLVLEFALGARLYVPVYRSVWVQKAVGAKHKPSQLSIKTGRSSEWFRSFCLEVLPSAYAWPGIGTFPELPQEQTDEAMAEWHRACAAYQKALHADAGYRKAAQEYFDRQSREPQPLLDWWVFRGTVVEVERIEPANVRDELILLIKQFVLRRGRKAEKLRREVETLETFDGSQLEVRELIPESVRLFVWQRDKGQCVKCGSRERLEFDHIIPVAKGGSNTERNIQLLCQSCNRSKGASV